MTNHTNKTNHTLTVPTKHSISNFLMFSWQRRFSDFLQPLFTFFFSQNWASNFQNIRSFSICHHIFSTKFTSFYLIWLIFFLTFFPKGLFFFDLIIFCQIPWFALRVLPHRWEPLTLCPNKNIITKSAAHS